MQWCVSMSLELQRLLTQIEKKFFSREIRDSKEFSGNELLEFLQDKNNLDEAVELGLCDAPAKDEPQLSPGENAAEQEQEPAK